MARKTSRSFDKIESRQQLVNHANALLMKGLRRNTQRSLVLLDEGGADLVGQVATGIKASQWHKDDTLARPVIEQAAQTGKSYLIADCSKEPLMAGREKRPASVLCVPILGSDDEVIGILYADNRLESGVYKDNDDDLVCKFAKEFAEKLKDFPTPEPAPAQPEPEVAREPAVEAEPAEESTVAEEAEVADEPEPTEEPEAARKPVGGSTAAAPPAEAQGQEVASRRSQFIVIGVALVVLAALLTFIVVELPSGRQTVPQRSAQDTAQAFVNDVLNGTYLGARDLLSKKLRAKHSASEFEAAMTNWATGKALADLKSRKIVEVESGPISATVYLTPISSGASSWTWSLVKEDGQWHLDAFRGGLKL